MAFRAFLFFVVGIATTLFSTASSRAVNITNAWVLPEEGFPVFYRYFRDHVSWYEADAVCQFHHASLVTVDATSQFDAVRAYLKELDISTNVWIGLSRTTGDTTFSWPSKHEGLSNEGHWQEAIPVDGGSLCAASDPSADFRWRALPCSGPTSAAFICELAVPSWATGAGGCLLTELPSLTVLYDPEQAALELTSDCGLEGTRRIACKGKADRDEMVKQLSCVSISNEEEEAKPAAPADKETPIDSIEAAEGATNPSVTSYAKSTKPWVWMSNTIETGDYGAPTRHRRETENTISPVSATESATEKGRELLVVTGVPAVKTQANKSSVRLEDPTKQVPATSSTEPDQEEAGEYPGTINQGQLFSIIENGTMFDIIELNETTLENMRAKDTVATTTPDNSPQPNDFYTTVIYHKEPPENVAEKSSGSTGKFEKKLVTPTFEDDRRATPNDSSLSKEVEMFPILTNSLQKLNRTDRKELPLERGEVPDERDAISKPQFEQLELEDMPHSEVGAKAVLKKYPPKKYHKGETGEKKEATRKQVEIEIDPGLERLNKNVSVGNRDYSEIVPTEMNEVGRGGGYNASESGTTDSEGLVESTLDVSDDINPTADGETETAPHRSEGSKQVEPDPQQRSRPNRQRLLTKPQRRSFYPYFFSRVLG